ncbi:MAG: DUF309 domain-containing protein [bacterium]
MSYVRLKHALSAIALESLGHPDTALAASAMAAYARGGAAGGAVPVDVLACDVAGPSPREGDPDAVRRALLDTGLFVEETGGIGLAAAYRPHAAYFRRQATRLAEALRFVAQPPPPGVPPDVHRGAALFDAGLYFEAHEYWEDVWRASRPPERTFYHGLVQAAAGRYHAEKGNAHGAAVLLAKARAKLDGFAPRYLGVDVTALLAALDAVRAGGSAACGPPQEATAIAGIFPRPVRPSR